MKYYIFSNKKIVWLHKGTNFYGVTSGLTYYVKFHSQSRVTTTNKNVHLLLDGFSMEGGIFCFVKDFIIGLLTLNMCKQLKHTSWRLYASNLSKSGVLGFLNTFAFCFFCSDHDARKLKFVFNVVLVFFLNFLEFSNQLFFLFFFLLFLDLL